MSSVDAMVDTLNINVPLDTQLEQSDIQGKGKGKGKGKDKGKMMDTGDESPSMEGWPYAEYPENAIKGHHMYTCLQTWAVSGDSKVIRFALPEGVKTLGNFGAPSCIKAKQEIGGHLLDKSYCPVSHPDVEGYVDLLVKRYEPTPGSGMSDFLCSRQPGDQVPIMVKPPRKLGKSLYFANRFKEMVMIGSGTGVAPLIQMGQVIFDDPLEKTKVTFITGQRSEGDMLLQDRIDEWVKQKPHQFSSHVTLSRPANAESWKMCGGTIGRIDAAFLKARMPAPAAGSGARLWCRWFP
mmetsp:Transcript_76414/g.166888  ORF Transcript_76414/g.166888 Transcript_76414/m.166888 type:complete len:294 (-) Transcript_76414:440-1321(-)